MKFIFILLMIAIVLACLIGMIASAVYLGGLVHVANPIIPQSLAGAGIFTVMAAFISSFGKVK